MPGIAAGVSIGVLQMRDLDTGSCWYESDVPQALGVSDIFDTDHPKF